MYTEYFELWNDIYSNLRDDMARHSAPRASIQPPAGHRAHGGRVLSDGWYDVAGVDDLEDDEAVKVIAAGSALALYRVDGRFYATADRCTHEQASLSDGWIQDGTVECPRHQGVFDIVSGKALTAPATEAVCTFPVRAEGDRVWVRVQGD